MRKGQTPKYRGKCSGCGKSRDNGKRYCKACDAAYMRGWRKVQRERLLAVVAHLERLEEQSGSDSGTGTEVILPEE